MQYLEQLHGLDVDVDGMGDAALIVDIRRHDERVKLAVVEQLLGRPLSAVVHADTDRGLVGNYSTEYGEAEEHEGYKQRVWDLGTHMNEQFKRGELVWMRKARDCLDKAPSIGCPGPWNGSLYYAI